MKSVRTGALLLLALAFGCADDRAQPALTRDVFAPLGEVMPRATLEQREAFARGRRVALHRFMPEQGLGPSFNLVSCAGCHERPVVGGAAGHYRDFLLLGAELGDGSFVLTGKNGVQPQFQTRDPVRAPSDPKTTLSATRNPIAFFGAGLLAEIADREILRRADPDDLDGDGISGRPNYDRGFVGRFGVKAQTVSVEGFIRGPLFNHLGITSVPLSPERKRALPVPSASPEANTTALLRALWISRAHAQVAAPDMPNFDDDAVPDPELSEQDLFDLVSFTMLLAPPPPDAVRSAQAEQGLVAFRELGCAACHVEDLQGPGGLVPAYSDLLLHDMGAALADGIRMGQALGSEFRTQPLWGVAATGPYLHDGRASTLDAAIRAHGGEAEPAQQAYLASAPERQAAVIAFLDSLGGRELAGPGMIVPGTPIAPAGTPGGPRAPLSAPEEERFLRGRALFDRDFSLQAGLGPSFNGDACRACHLDPVPGGAGPADVDVTRQGQLDAHGQSVAPGHGSLLHRHQLDGTRPQADTLVSVFERRQTPTLLGLGLVDEIAEAAVLAHADPADTDGDGVSGVARRLEDGRLGKLGWKLNVATLRDFARDGLSNELGITLPPSESTFGSLADDDTAPDPELDATDLEDLVFWLEQLAPPARDLSVAPPAQLAEGEALFAQVGCTGCHVPSLPTQRGEQVALFSDLLLHEVANADYVGIRDGEAAPRELRTPPLWGLRHTAPYLHDGRASDIEQAVAGHAAEAERARRAYEQLSAEQRSALLAFLRSL